MTESLWKAATAEIVGSLEEWAANLARCARRVAAITTDEIKEAAAAVSPDIANNDFQNKPNWMLFATLERCAGDAAVRTFCVLLQSCLAWLDGIAKCDFSDDLKAQQMLSGAWAFYNDYPHAEGQYF